jgi:transcription elongation factor Elf1
MSENERPPKDRERHFHNDGAWYQDYATCHICNKETHADIVTRVKALEARVAELEKKLAEALFPVTFLACPRCGHHMQHKPTGKILTSMPPQTEIKCVGCGLTRGIE